MSQLSVPRSYLISRIPAAQHSRVIVDASANYRRDDNDERDSSSLPAVGQQFCEVAQKWIKCQEIYNSHQAESFLRNSTLRIVCQVETNDFYNPIDDLSFRE